MNTTSAESFLAQTGYSDSRPHSAPEIARLMEDYSKLRNAELHEQIEELCNITLTQTNRRS